MKSSYCSRIVGMVHMAVLSDQFARCRIPVALQANQVAAEGVNASRVEHVYHLSK
jgi:hypothetical protein